MLKLVLIFCLVMMESFACTDFILSNQKNQHVVGRSMEFGTNLESEIVVFPSGEKRQSKIKDKIGMQWKQKYSFVGVSAFRVDQWVIDGVNEKGLSLGELWMPGTKYPSISSENCEKTISLQDIGAWILGSFATVAEVKKGLQEVCIYPNVATQLGEITPLHFTLHDKAGNSIVVEFIEGQMQISDNSVGVLTNFPPFKWQVTNLDNYINLSAVNKGPVSFSGTVLGPTGQGSGMLGLPGDWTPPSRFVKTSLVKEFVKKVATQRENVNLAFHLLNMVDIPYGAVQSADKKSFDYTQWIVVKDLTNGNLHYRTYDNMNIRSVDLQDAAKKGFQKIQMDTR